MKNLLELASSPKKRYYIRLEKDGKSQLKIIKIITQRKGNSQERNSDIFVFKEHGYEKLIFLPATGLKAMLAFSARTDV